MYNLDVHLVHRSKGERVYSFKGDAWMRESQCGGCPKLRSLAYEEAAPLGSSCSSAQWFCFIVLLKDRHGLVSKDIHDGQRGYMCLSNPPDPFITKGNSNIITRFEKGNCLVACILGLSKVVALGMACNPRCNRFRVSTPLCGIAYILKIAYIVKYYMLVY